MYLCAVSPLYAKPFLGAVTDARRLVVSAASLLLRFIMISDNKKRDKLADMEGYSPESSVKGDDTNIKVEELQQSNLESVVEDLTDFQQKNFRYAL